MKGVKFHKAMWPYAPGSTALLPVERADAMIREGYATFYRFPDRPHAVDACAQPAPAAAQPDRKPNRQTYQTKGA